MSVTRAQQLETQWRPPRLRLAHTTPAVLRVESGGRVRGTLQVISQTGGLLCLSSPLSSGSRVKLMCLTDAGALLGTAEMLASVSATQQPFRFVSMNEDDQRRLRDLIQVSLEINRAEQQAIIKDRTW
ncbi:MAG TPA: hypothetical protein VFA40_18640 [Terriglobales bacterium]|nr:hypothetical protein [Terriglobales bacterium]